METLRKIGELIEQNKTLEQRNEELKNIIVANLNQPQNDLVYSFSDATDLSDIKTLIVKFYQFKKIPIAFFNDKGKLLFSMGWKNESAFFLQNYDEILQEYNETAKLQASKKPGQFFKRRNGIHAIAIPVEARNSQIATIILSQFFYREEMPTIDSFKNLAERSGLNPELYYAALKYMPILSTSELETIAQYASFLGEMISLLSLKKIEYQKHLRKQTNDDMVFATLREKIAEQEKIIKSLLQNICTHENEVRENTISKTSFQRQQKQLIDQIKHSDALLNSLLTSLPLGIGFVRTEIFTYINDQMFRISGYKPKELIGRSPEILFASPNDFATIMESTSNPFKDQKSFETPLVNKNGDIIDTIIFVSQIDASDPGLGIAFSIMDISEIKKVQRELIIEKERAQESDRLKTVFLDNMSHEFRTPMNAIIGFTGLINSPYFTDKQKDDYYKIVQNKGKKLLRLIDDIIDISKLSANQLQLHHKSFSLQEIMTDIYDTFTDYVQKKHGQDVILKWVPPGNNTEDLLFSDDFRIKQIINNLLSNSLKFTTHGYIEFGYKLTDEYVHFYVKDTGKGIKKAQQKYIFERFRQCDESLTKEHGGAGLGLSLAKGLVELMGGKIWLESQWGKGSTFHFTIPLNADEHLTSSNSKNIANDWSKKTILIAEDEELNYKYLQTLLLPTNVNIKWVDNGQKAIDFIQNDPTVNLILMDIRMPIVNGLEATRIIKSTNKEIPIIAQTAYAQSNERDSYINAGCDEFIPKPINSQNFIMVLEKFLNSN